MDVLAYAAKMLAFFAQPETIVAAAALGFAIWQGRETRRHDRLSVRPRLNIYGGIEPIDQNTSQLVVRARNAGIGPAVTSKYRAWVDGVEIDPRDDKIAQAWLDKLLGPGLFHVGHTFDLRGEHTIPAGDHVDLFGAFFYPTLSWNGVIHSRSCASVWQ